VLQYVAVCCSIVQYVAVLCSALQCVAVLCSALQYVTRLTPHRCIMAGCPWMGARHSLKEHLLSSSPLYHQWHGRYVCSVLQCVAVCCAACCSALQCVAVCCSVSSLKKHLLSSSPLYRQWHGRYVCSVLQWFE